MCAQVTETVAASASGDGVLAPCAEYAGIDHQTLRVECSSERPWLKLSPGNASHPCSSEAYIGDVCLGRLGTWQDCGIGNAIPTFIKESADQSKFEENVVTLEELLGVVDICSNRALIVLLIPVYIPILTFLLLSLFILIDIDILPHFHRTAGFSDLPVIC